MQPKKKLSGNFEAPFEIQAYQHCNSVNSFCPISTSTCLLKWRTLCKSASVEGLRSLIESNLMIKAHISEASSLYSVYSLDLCHSEAF